GVIAAAGGGDTMAAVHLLECAEHRVRVPALVGVVLQYRPAAVPLVGGGIAGLASAVHNLLSCMRSGRGCHDATGGGAVILCHGHRCGILVELPGQGDVPSWTMTGPRRTLGWPGEHDEAGERSPAEEVGGRHARPRGRVVTHSQRQRIGSVVTSPVRAR